MTTLPPFEEWVRHRPAGVCEPNYYAWLKIIEAEWGQPARYELERAYHEHLARLCHAKGDKDGMWAWHRWHGVWVEIERNRIEEETAELDARRWDLERERERKLRKAAEPLPLDPPSREVWY